MTTSANWANQTVWTGDNLPILRGMNSNSVDLIYLDPPFNSKADYAAPIGSAAAGAAFKDTWTLSDIDAEWINLIEAKHPALYRVLMAARSRSDKSYLAYMAARLLETRRVLKPTGSIWLHCDPTMSHYLKLVMDAVFGKRLFRNEIVWKRTSSHQDAHRFGRVSDRLLFYGAPIRRDATRVPLEKAHVESKYRNKDGRGWYADSDLSAAGTRTGESGETWRDWNPTDIGCHWKAPRTGKYAAWIEENLIPGYRAESSILARLDMLHEAGLIHFTSTGTPRLKRYLAASPGQVPSDVWVDIPPVNARAKERTGYPTQKPLALLRRVIAASSDPGDMVLDPFCGCATACIAAELEGRNWAGIDISPTAATLVERRMRNELGLFYDGAHREDIPRRTDLGQLPRPASHRQALYGLQEGHCEGCRVHFRLRDLEVDHIISRKRGGTDHIENLQLLCASCNRIKGDRGMEYLRVKLQL